MGASLAAAGRFLVPNVLYEPDSRFKALKPEDYPEGPTFMANLRVFLFRKGNSFRAASAVCTHLGCITNWKADEGLIACPCHGSKFTQAGDKTAGPAPRALPRFAMSLDDQGSLVVDKSVIVGEESILKV